MITKFTWHYLYLFLQSSMLEIPFYYLGLRKFVTPLATRSLFEREKILLFLCLVTAVNSVTHPVIFFGIMNLKFTFLQDILIAESFAIISEGLFMRWFFQASIALAFSVALTANLASWQLAPWLTYLIFK